ncbi:hypothetical protein DVH24_025703 [Malus domestica]|uniref:Uncharacterized protein n=1 Tax=Malus domestica TaxID=3750 RepID=A0A498KGN8_MALDO|nr:hypothetical protein DVH24_025703 [Malus domestica]
MPEKLGKLAKITQGTKRRDGVPRGVDEEGLASTESLANGSSRGPPILRGLLSRPLIPSSPFSFAPSRINRINCSLLLVPFAPLPFPFSFLVTPPCSRPTYKQSMMDLGFVSNSSGDKKETLSPLVFFGTTSTMLDIIMGITRCEKEHAERQAKLLEAQTSATDASFTETGAETWS